MTDSESNSVRRELAAFKPIGDHPDPDVITAFAEGFLLEEERLAVVRHLADCAECRAVLSFAAGDEAAPPTHALKADSIRHVARFPFRNWIAWGAVAAGIAIACTVALRYEWSRTVQPSPVAQKPEAPAKAPPEVAQLAASPAMPETPQKKSATSPHLSRKQAAPPEGAMAKAAQQQPTQQQSEAQGIQQIAGQSSYSPLVSQPLRETEAQSSDLRLAVPRAPSPSFSNAAAAKVVAGPQAIPPARVHWRIDNQGQPERAFGDGPWQPILFFAGSRMRVLSILNGEVWIGGENSRVYRSSDEGTTWREVPLPAKNGSEHSIVHIRFEAAQMGTIEAADGTTWQTTDGGNTWK